MNEYKRILDGVKILSEGRIFRLLVKTMEYVKNNKKGVREIEFAERSPGVRGIVCRNGSILMIKEFRSEHNNWDYRLPGGKVFDRLSDYLRSLEMGNIEKHVEFAVEKELLEEVGIKIGTPKLLHRSVAGATIIWDLFYFEVSEFTYLENGLSLEEDEIIYPEWKTYEEVKQLCLQGNVMEDRTVGVLLRYILSKELQ